mmetsp:Transcript_22432/g.49934  ORF Transcript_22432/g.49934 Transcript_22432/m.49934 type:complete len:442 (-) Transcript_22432:86-1411(-)
MAQWWHGSREQADGFVPLMRQDAGGDSSGDAAGQQRQHDKTNANGEVGVIRLLPPQRRVRALSVLKTHDATIDDTSLGALGGVLIRLSYLARDHPPVSMEPSTYVLPWTGFIVYCIVVGLVHGYVRTTLDDSVQDNAFLSLLFYVAVMVPVFFVKEGALERRHRKTQTYLTALQNFRDGARALLDELDRVLRPHGYHLVVEDIAEGNDDDEEAGCSVPVLKNPPGTMLVKLRLGGETSGGGANRRSLPPVSAEFLDRETPLTEVQAALAMHCLLARGVPVDEWTLGALMIRLRCAQTELRRGGRFGCISRAIFIATFGTVIAAALVLYLCFDVDGSVILALWWIPFLLLMFPYAVLIRYVQERMEGEAKHKLFRAATEKVSSLARHRHGVELVYRVEPTFFRGFTKGVIKFVVASPPDVGVYEEGEAATCTGSTLVPVNIV